MWLLNTVPPIFKLIQRYHFPLTEPTPKFRFLPSPLVYELQTTAANAFTLSDSTQTIYPPVTVTALPKSAFNVILLSGILLPITVSTMMVSLAIGVPEGNESAPALYKLQIRLIFTDFAGVGVTENP